MVCNNINGKTKGYVLFPHFQIYENCSELCNIVGLNLFNFKVKHFNIQWLRDEKMRSKTSVVKGQSMLYRSKSVLDS